jgi:hypothetical protein
VGIAPRFSCTLRSLRTFLGISLVVIGCGGSSPQRKSAGYADAPDDRRPSPAHPDGSASSPKPSTATSNDLSIACKRTDVFGPFELDGEQALRRRGLGDRLFSDTVTSCAR